LPYYYEYELTQSAFTLVKDLFKLKKGEEFVITADTESDSKVVDTVASVAFSIGAKPIVIWIPSPLGVGKEADSMIPLKTLTSLLKEADAWVEFNNKWLLYSTPWEIALKENKKLRHMCLVGMNTDMMVRCIGRVNYELLNKFQAKVVELTRKAENMHITTTVGTDISFKNDPNLPITYESGYADTPGSHFMIGQIGWAPIYESIEGLIVFDGSLSPPIGLLRNPIKLYVKKGKIEKIEGGIEATIFESWLKNLNDENMFLLAHVCYGFHPNAILSGNILEDERVWGCIEWGIGSVDPGTLPPNGRQAKSHCDGICLNASIWLDDVQLLDKGKVIHPELVKLAKMLGKF